MGCGGIRGFRRGEGEAPASPATPPTPAPTAAPTPPPATAPINAPTALKPTVLPTVLAPLPAPWCDQKSEARGYVLPPRVTCVNCSESAPWPFNWPAFSTWATTPCTAAPRGMATDPPLTTSFRTTPSTTCPGAVFLLSIPSLIRTRSIVPTGTTTASPPCCSTRGC